jgi:hypothetical protein
LFAAFQNAADVPAPSSSWKWKMEKDPDNPSLSLSSAKQVLLRPRDATIAAERRIAKCFLFINLPPFLL